MRVARGEMAEGNQRNRGVQQPNIHFGGIVKFIPGGIVASTMYFTMYFMVSFMVAFMVA